MGTRGSVIIVKDGESKGYYNQFDCYPMGGLGEEIIAEMKKIDIMDGWEQFAENVRKVELVKSSKVPSKEVQQKYIDKGFHNSGVSTGLPTEWYSLLRELQGVGYIQAIVEGTVEHMLDGTKFVEDSSCSYAYVIDLDKMVLEFYRGCQNKSQSGNRFGTRGSIEEGFPCAKVGQLSLKGIAKDDRAVEIMNELYEKNTENNEQ